MAGPPCDVIVTWSVKNRRDRWPELLNLGKYVRGNQTRPVNSEGGEHKVLTYIEYRAVSGVFRTIDPPTPSPPSECVLPPAPKAGDTHSPGGEGVGGGNNSEDARHWISLLQYNSFTVGRYGDSDKWLLYQEFVEGGRYLYCPYLQIALTIIICCATEYIGKWPRFFAVFLFCSNPSSLFTLLQHPS